MQSFLTAITLLCCFLASAQDKKPAKKVNNDEGKVFVRVEYEGGTDRNTWNKHIREQLKAAPLSDSLKAAMPSSGFIVDVHFIVDKYGRMTDVRAVKDPGGGLGALAVKIVSSYRGKWEPANQCGRFVNSYKKERIVFGITEE